MATYSTGIIHHLSGSKKHLQLNLYYMFRNDTRYTWEIQSRTTMERAPFNKNKALFTSKLDLILRKKLLKCYIWSIPLCGDEWTLRKADRKYLETFEMWCWRRPENRRWTDRVRKVLQRIRRRGISYIQ